VLIQIFSNASEVAFPVVHQRAHLLEYCWQAYLLFENNMLVRITICRMMRVISWKILHPGKHCISSLEPLLAVHFIALLAVHFIADSFNGSTCFKCISASSWHMSRTVHILHQLRKSLSEEGQIDFISDIVICSLKQVQQSLKKGMQLCREKYTHTFIQKGCFKVLF